MAMLCMLEERRSQKATYPLLSCSDIEVLLAQILRRRDVTVEEVVRQMELGIKARQQVHRFSLPKTKSPKPATAGYANLTK